MTEQYKLILGDCLEVMKDISDNSIDLILTDPPYKVTSRGNAGNSGGMLQKEINIKGQVFEHNDIEMKDYIPELYRILKEDSHCYMMTNHINLYEMLTITQQVGFHFTKCLIWNKGNKIMGQAYMSQFEYILFLTKGKYKLINNCGTPDILDVPNKKVKDILGENRHDTEKPVELMEILINNSSKKGEVVLDMFMGSGSTGVAAVRNERKFIGIEIDENYFNIAKKRLENANYKQLKLF